MLIDDLVRVLNTGYICPADAGPAWRRAVAEGMDMSLVERTLAKNPWERLQDHDEALGFGQMLQNAVAHRRE